MKPLDQLFADIAREHLNIETLKPRRRDALDFHDVAVWSVKAALAAAFDAGAKAASPPCAEPSQTCRPASTITKSSRADATAIPTSQTKPSSSRVNRSRRTSGPSMAISPARGSGHRRLRHVTARRGSLCPNHRSARCRQQHI